MDDQADQLQFPGMEPTSSGQLLAEMRTLAAARKSESGAQAAIRLACSPSPVPIEAIADLVDLPMWVIRQQLAKMIRSGEIVIEYHLGIDGERAQYWTVPDELEDLKVELRRFRRDMASFWPKRRIDLWILDWVRHELATRRRSGATDQYD